MSTSAAPVFSFRAWLQLVRLPAVFTAQADIFLGFLLNHQSPADAPQKFGLLLLASSCLYLAGMVFNDVFDRNVDAAERPERPIPSGRVSVGSAVRLGIVLLLAGVGAATVVGVQSLFISLGIVAGVLAYDGFLKKTALGPLAMGGCRFLNVMLGASAQDYPFGVWGRPQTLVAASLAVYIVGVTWFARQEAGQSSRWQLAGAAAVVNGGLAGLLWLIVTYPWPGQPNLGNVLLLFAIIVLTIDRRLVSAVVHPGPQRVQGAVRMMLLSLIMLDATMVFVKTGNEMLGLATAALVVPAMILGRWVYVT